MKYKHRSIRILCGLNGVHVKGLRGWGFMAATIQPITDKERLMSIDVVRGIALIGITLVNAQFYLIFTLFSPKISFPSHSFDPYIDVFHVLFIHTKFYSIFSFLFGLGSYLFISRVELHGAPVRFFSRRLFAMLFLGCLHVMTWFGSVLPVYAILGFPLMLFYRRKPRTILVWAFGIYGLVILQQLFQFPRFPWPYNLTTDFVVYFGMFLLGLYTGKRNIITKMKNHRQLLRHIQIVSMFLSMISLLGMMFLFFKPDRSGPLTISFFYRVNTYPMTLFYLSSLFRVLNHKTSLKVLKPIANMGKMGLTVYVGQNLLGTLFVYLFNWSATGYTLVQSFYMAVLIIMIELIAVNLYFMKFKRGPLESIWRKVTYGFSLPTKRTYDPVCESLTKGGTKLPL